jgi:hypothetical protein
MMTFIVGVVSGNKFNLFGDTLTRLGIVNEMVAHWAMGYSHYGMEEYPSMFVDMDTIEHTVTIDCGRYGFEVYGDE